MLKTTDFINIIIRVVAVESKVRRIIIFEACMERTNIA